MKYKHVLISLLSLIAIGCSSMLPTPQAFAHFLQTSNGIGGVIHVEPNDKPLIVVDTQLFIELKDTKNRLSESNCSCTLELKKNDTIITSTQPNISKTSDATILVSQSVVFPEKGVYQIKLAGTPKQQEFEPFTLLYDIRADEKRKESIPVDVNVVIGGVSLVAVVVLIFWYLRKNS
jgi:hypothetical protein